MRFVVTGGTGFVGQALVTALRGDAAAEIRVLSRSPGRVRNTFGAGVEGKRWDPHDAVLAPDALAGAAAVFNLAGENVAGRWSGPQRTLMRESRVQGTQALVGALRALPDGERPAVLVQASAVGFYGDRGDALLDEESEPGRGFLAELCVEWEGAARAAEALGVRVVRLRFGVVLGRGGGALAKMLPAFRAGLGGRLGSGRQWMPWVALEDAVSLLRAAALRDDLSGAINAVSPQQVTNAELTRALSAVLGRPAVLAVPALALKVALGEASTMLLGSQRVVPRALGRAGFTFAQPALDGALRAALG